MNLKILFYLVVINCVICDDVQPTSGPPISGIELSCGADRFSITISDDSVFPNPNSAGNNKIKIGSCEFDLSTTPETVEAWISHIRKIMSDFGQVS